MTIILPIILLFVLFIVGMPIGFSLGITGVFGIYLVGGLDAVKGLLTLTPYGTSASFLLSSIPMFILMAEFAARGGLAKDLYNLAHKCLGHLPGGLAIASVFASAGMGAMSGASTASAAAMAAVCIPEMERYHYKRFFSAATVATGGTLSIMIPPSVPMLVYGVQTETSIGQLFIGGIIPGILTTIIYSAGIMMWVILKPDLAQRIKAFPFREMIKAFTYVWPIVLLVVLVIGGMYLGLVTPTEAGALGSAGALIITLAMRRINWKNILGALYNTALTTIMIMTIVIGAHFFVYFLTMGGISDTVNRLIITFPLSPLATLILLIIPVYIVLGFFMDNIPILLLTLPVTFPAALNLGFDPIWFGVLVIALGEIGLITPPVGLTAFVVSSVADIPVEEVFKGLVPLVTLDLVVIIFLIAFPELVTYLPGLM